MNEILGTIDAINARRTVDNLSAELATLRAQRDELLAALEGIFAQTTKHARQWGQIESAAAFARDPDTATAFAKARAAIAKARNEQSSA